MSIRHKYLRETAKEALVQMGNNIRQIRTLKGMTQKKFCQESGISRMTLHAIENGSPSVLIGNLQKVLQTFGMENHVARIGIIDDNG